MYSKTACWVLLVLWLLGLLWFNKAYALDSGQWEDTPPEVKAWFKSLKQPNNPIASCCGEGDAYWADSFEVVDGRYVAIITDPRPDGPLNRTHREIGTRVPIPDRNVVDATKQQNPTGHGIVFLSPTGNPGVVYCYLPPGGV